MPPQAQEIAAVYRIKRVTDPDGARGNAARLAKVEGARLAALHKSLGARAKPSPGDSVTLAGSGHRLGAVPLDRVKDLVSFGGDRSGPAVVQLPDLVRVIGPPYDAGWSEGLGGLGRDDGHLWTLGDDRFCASGLAVNLSSPSDVFATVEFIGQFDYFWSSLEDLPAAASSGGLGVCVYRGTEAAPVITRLNTSYVMRSPRAFTGLSETRNLADVLTGTPGPHLGTFAIPVQPLSLLMEAGQSYSFWIWCWQAQVGTKGKSFLAGTRCTVPMIVLTTSDPYLPPLR